MHVTDSYLPTLGGIELHVRDLARGQRRAGHDVAVLTRTPAARVADAEDDDVRDPQVHEPQVQVERLRCGRLAVGAGAEIRRIVARFDPDVVQTHLSVASPFAWEVLRAVDRPVVATMHSMVPDSQVLLRAALTLIRFPAHRVMMTAVSEAAAGPWRGALGREAVTVLPNGIDPAAWNPAARQPRPAGRAAFTVVSVGRFTRRKRQSALIRVLQRVRRLRPDLVVRAVLVGDGPERSAVRAEARRAGLADQVRFPGVLSREEIRATLVTADAYLAPATLESFGIAALEARCAGVPVVGMAASGICEFITHEREGLLAHDDDDLADQLLRLVTEPVLHETIRAHNLGTAPDLAWPAVLRRHDVAYASAVSAVAAGPRAAVPAAPGPALIAIGP